MSSGAPRGGGKNQHTDNVTMASNDGKIQNLPRMGGKNQSADHTNMPTNNGKMQNTRNSQYFDTPHNASNVGMMHRINSNAAPQFAQVTVPNPTIYTPSGQLTQDASEYYSLQVSAPSQPMPVQQGYPPYGGNAYGIHPAPYNTPYWSPAYQQNITYSQQQGYAQPMSVSSAEIPQMTQAAPPAPRLQREKKPLLIVDPKTQSEVQIGPSKPSSASATPNTTVEADDDGKEIEKREIRKQLMTQLKDVVGAKDDKKESEASQEARTHSEKKPEALSNLDHHINEIKQEATTLPDGNDLPPSPEETKEQVQEDHVEHNDELSLPTIAFETPDADISNTAVNEEIRNDTVLLSDSQIDDVPSLQVTTVDAEVSSPSISVEHVTEGDEEDPVLSPTLDDEENEAKLQEEEAERLRQREFELDTLLEELKQDPKECDEVVGYYGRKFLYCIRDIEKEFKRTEPPVPLEDLKNTFGIDIQSMPKMTDKKRTADFNPPWAKTNSMGQGPRKYPVGRSSHDRSNRGGGGGGGKKPYVGRPSSDKIDRPPKVQLVNKAVDAWKPEKIKPGDADNEELRLKALLKAVRALLNKITPTTKDDLIKEFLALHVSGKPPQFSAPEEQLPQVIDIIFDKAVDEPKFCSLYSEICKRQVDFELKTAKNSSFRNALLNRSQNTFVNKTMEDNKAAIDNETDEEKKKVLLLKYEEDYSKFRRRKFGNINFIGQLYDQSLLSTRIIQWCLFDLLRHSHPDQQGNLPEPPYDEESIHCATQLVEIVGKSFETCKDFDGAGTYLGQIFDHMLKIAPKCTPKIRFKIMGIMELRANGWRQRKVVDQGPKKIAEIHQEIEAEHQQLIQERDAYERKQGQGVRQGSNSLRRNAPPARGSLDSRVNTTQNKRAAAGTASKLVPSSAGPPRQMSMSITSSTSKKSNWRTGSGGGGNEAPGSRTIIQRNSGSREGSENRKMSGMTERDSALQAARDIGGNAPHRSNSQLSVADQEDAEKNEELENERRKIVAKIANSVKNKFDELENGDLTEEEIIEELFAMTKEEKYGLPDVETIFEQYVHAYILLRNVHRPAAAKVLYKCLLKPDSKGPIIKGIENYCHWAVQSEAWEDNANIWDILAELLVNVALTEAETGEATDSPAVHSKATTLEDFSPIFVAASYDVRPKRIYSLLILTLKQMAERLAIQNENLTGLAMDFLELSCCKELEPEKLKAALKGCNPDVPNFDNLYDVLYQ